MIFTIFGGEMDLPARWFCRLGGGIRYTLYIPTNKPFNCRDIFLYNIYFLYIFYSCVYAYT